MFSNEDIVAVRVNNVCQRGDSFVFVSAYMATFLQHVYISIACSQKSFKYQGAKIWNLIPTEIKQLTFHKSKIEFKKKLLESYC